MTEAEERAEELLLAEQLKAELFGWGAGDSAKWFADHLALFVLKRIRQAIAQAEERSKRERDDLWSGALCDAFGGLFSFDDSQDGIKRAIRIYIEGAKEDSAVQAEARTLAAAADELDKRASVAITLGQTQDGWLLEGMAKAIRSLQPSSDALKKLLRDVAERVQAECRKDCLGCARQVPLGPHKKTGTIGHFDGYTWTYCEAEGTNALDLDRIVEEALGGKRE